MAPRTDAPSVLRARGTIACALMGARRRFIHACRGGGVEGCVKNMTVLAQDHIHLPDHHARLARVLRPELRAAPRPLPREGS